MSEQNALFGARASMAAGDVDAVFLFILAIAGFFFVLTQGLLIYFALRYLGVESWVMNRLRAPRDARRAAAAVPSPETGRPR